MIIVTLFSKVFAYKDHNSLGIVIAVLVFALVGTAVTPGTIAAQSASPQSADRALQLQQVPLMQAADELERFIQVHKLSGWAGTELQVEKNEVKIYWKGVMSKELRDEIKRLQATAKIVTSPAKYTKEELKQAAAAVMQAPTQYLNVKIVVPAVDGSGLLVGLRKGATKKPTTFPVDAKVYENEAITPSARRDDTPYFSGGARISRPLPDNMLTFCSTAFSAYRPGQSLTPERYMLSAFHCSGELGTAWHSGQNPAAEPVMGKVEKASSNTDSIAIRTDTTARVYDGGVGDGSEYFKPVVGLGTNRPGTYVCTSGSVTGVHCNIKIINTDVSYSFDTGQQISNGVFASQMDDRVAIGGGDSGGPVFALSSDPSKVVGMGIMSGHRTSDLPVFGYPRPREVPCTYDGRTCANNVLFVDLAAVLRTHSLTLHTASTTTADPQFSDDVHADGKLLVADIDGDNRDDLLMPYTNGRMSVLLAANTGDKMAFATTFSLPSSTSGNNYFPMRINTDNRTDLVVRRSNGNLEIWLSNGATLQYAHTVTTAYSDAQGWAQGNRFQVMNIDGDARDELVARFASGAMAVWRSNGSTLVYYSDFPTPFTDASGWNSENRFLVSDLDGDNRDDLLARYASGAFAVWRSDGRVLGYFSEFATAHSDANGWLVGNRLWTANVIGDHRKELLARYADGSFAIWQSNGRTMSYYTDSTSSYSDVKGWNTGTRFYPMDINGDGREGLLARQSFGTFDILEPTLLWGDIYKLTFRSDFRL